MQRQKEIYQKVLDASSSIDGVLLERSGSAAMPGLSKGEWVSGYSPNYLRVLVPASEATGLRNQIVSVKPKELVVDDAAGDVALLSELIR
jgi:hypothetical protein